VADTELYHYGILRKSGRYPWGSGGTPEENHRSFQGYVRELREKGLSDTQIAEGFEISTTDFRALKSIARNEIQKANASQALRLKDKGLSNVAIGQRMHIPESSVRSLLQPALQNRKDILVTTADLLASKIKDGGYLDIGSGTANHLSISDTKLATSVAILKQRGYEVRNVQVDQVGTGAGKKTTVKTLVPPGSPKFIDPTQIKTVAAYSEDGGNSYEHIEPPVNIRSSRIAIRYAEQGGGNADGVIYVRPGVRDVSLGSARYAQVRIAVDGTHYLKGMAMYKDDMPPGVDLQFNTNKHDTGNKLDALKKQKDEENPFGSTVRQRHYIDGSGKRRLSPMNIVNEEGDWQEWSRSLSSQVLSKQSTQLARRQLDFAFKDRQDELLEINRLTNPVVRKKLLESFSDDADAAAVHLKAKALPSQRTHVILPFESLKENEIYAPNYINGTKVALVRFPHGGTFEIPEVTVNNKNREANATLGQRGEHLGKAPDAIGIHPKIAARLSGADFDGDTVLVIPNTRGELKTSPPLAKLKDFDPQESYAPYDGMKTIDGGTYNAKTRSVDYGTGHPSGKRKQTMMGDVSNLITDMTIKGAKPDELAAAVRHSMVVIDAEKHHLDFRRSYNENGIPKLKERYQGRGATGRLAGASTIVSRASSEVRVLDRRARSSKLGGPVNPVTGEKEYELTGKQFTDRQGRVVVRTAKSTKLAEAKNAHTLSSGMPIENIYAEHSNRLKALANDARKTALTTGNLVHSPSATKTYAKEVSRLNAALNNAKKNRPLERQAQLIAASTVRAIKESNPGMDPADLKKASGRALLTARHRVGADKHEIIISESEWRAIQEGAISSTKLREILDNADAKTVRKLATPRAATVMTPSKLAIAKARLASGYTQAEIAASLGVPVSTLNSALHVKEDNG
jgi:DNA-binding NarL/FixJ family response regulator